MFGSVGGGVATGNSLANIAQGLRSGTATGEAQAALGAAGLANKGGAFGGASSNVGGALGAAGGVLGVYNGIQQGGVLGYGNAAAGALRAGSGLASLAGNAGLAGNLGNAAGALAVPLSIYSEVQNWKSGATGSDALSGAETGAAIGSIVPGLGTAAGALIGGAAGALSSVFGPGKQDPETADVNNLINATSQSGNTPAIAASVQNPYLQIAGLFDDKSSTLPMYQQYGRTGEQQFTNDMVTKINDAVASGTISKSSTPQEVYNNVVAPWVAGMGNGWSNVGSTYQATTQGLLQDMVSQYMAGTASTNWKAVGGDSPFASLPAFGSAASTPAPYLGNIGNLSYGARSANQRM